jgi:hypothetical protein
MFPWLWIYAPATYEPLSGPVTQSLEAFFGGIRPGAGVPAIEQRVFEQASYGKQLGWLIDVVLATTEASALPPGEARRALECLKQLQNKMTRIKEEHRKDQADAAIALLDRIAADDPQEIERLLERYRDERAPRTLGRP